MSEVGAHRMGAPVVGQGAYAGDGLTSSSRPLASSPEARLPEDMSLGDLLGRMTGDLSILFRDEVALAKVEMKEEATKAAKGAGMFGGAGFAGYMAIVLLSFAAAWGLAEVIPVGLAFLVIGVLYVLAAGGLFVVGRKKMQTVHGPQQTVQTVKKDAQWARKQMS